MTLRRPGRLPDVAYVGIQRYSLTLCTFERHQWFENAEVAVYVRSQLLQSAVDHQFAIPAYCFMPDHLHVLAEGLTVTADLERFVSLFKQKGWILVLATASRAALAGWLLRSDSEE